jgi:hypothetical protein
MRQVLAGYPQKSKVLLSLSVTSYIQFDLAKTHPDAAGRQLEDFVAAGKAASGGSLPDRVSFDTYQFPSGKTGQTSWSMLPCLNNVLGRCQKLGLKMHLGEFGICPQVGDTDTLRAGRIQPIFTWMKQNNVSGAYWENYKGNTAPGATTDAETGFTGVWATWPKCAAVVKAALIGP